MPVWHHKNHHSISQPYRSIDEDCKYYKDRYWYRTMRTTYLYKHLVDVYKTVQYFSPILCMDSTNLDCRQLERLHKWQYIVCWCACSMPIWSGLTALVLLYVSFRSSRKHLIYAHIINIFINPIFKYCATHLYPFVCGVNVRANKI